MTNITIITYLFLYIFVRKLWKTFSNICPLYATSSSKDNRYMPMPIKIFFFFFASQGLWYTPFLSSWYMWSVLKLRGYGCHWYLLWLDVCNQLFIHVYKFYLNLLTVKRRGQYQNPWLVKITLTYRLDLRI